MNRMKEDFRDISLHKSVHFRRLNEEICETFAPKSP